MSGRLNGSRRSIGEARRLRTRPRLEALEPRQLLANFFTVLNTGDSAITPGSLRYEILALNSSTLSGANVLNFQISNDGNIQTITPLSALPQIARTVTVDGTTELTSQGLPAVFINGVSAGAGSVNGLTISAGGVVVKSIGINNFSGSGILVQGTQDTIQNTFLGTDFSGNNAQGNSLYGLTIASSASNALIRGNLISGNIKGGVDILGSSNNQLLGNRIGTNNGGNGAVPNLGNGVDVSGIGTRNVIGSNISGGSNIISGNAGNGINLSQSSLNTIQSNYIGTDGTLAGVGGGGGGRNPIPNGGAGVAFNNSSNNQIGGPEAGDGNIISANSLQGIVISNGSAKETIQGNIIGANLLGQSGIGNGQAGIAVFGGSKNGTAIGGTISGVGNTIAYNGIAPTGSLGFAGVDIETGDGISILSNAIYGNGRLGIILDSTLTQPLPNTGAGSTPGEANLLQPFPVITSVGTASGRTHIEGTFSGLPHVSYTLQFFSNPADDPLHFGQGQTLLPYSPQITTDLNGNYTINTTLNFPTVIGTFISATATDPNGNTSEFSGPNVVVGTAQTADIGLNFSQTSPTAAATNSPLSYVLNVTNNGPDPATDVNVTDHFTPAATGTLTTLPAGAIATADGFTLTIPTIAVGQTVAVSFTGTATAIGDYVNSASVGSDQIDPTSSNDIASLTTQVSFPADLQVLLNPVSTIVGTNFTIAGVVTNNGPGVGGGTTVVVKLPAGFTYIQTNLNQGTSSFNGSTNTVTINLGSLSSTGIQAFNIVATAPSTSGSYPITATVSSQQLDGNPNNNTVTINAVVAPASDLSVSVSANPEPVLIGNNLTYTYTVTNNGPSEDAGVSLKDTLPSDAVFISGSGPLGPVFPVGTLLSIPLGILTPGQTVTGTFTIQPTISELITNTAVVSGDNADPTSGNNTATTVSTVSPADLSVVINPSSDPGVIGQPLTYTVLVTNNGPANATNVKVVNSLPPNATFISASGPGGTLTPSGNLLTAPIGTLAPGQSALVTIVVLPTTSVVLTDSASAVSDQYDPNPSNNTATSQTAISPADLSVGLGTSTTNTLALTPFTFTAFISNSGPNDATNVLLGDVFPSGLTILSATSSQGSVFTGSGLVGAQLGTIPAGRSATVTIVAQALAAGTFANSVTVTSDQVDPNPQNNTSSAAVTVTNAPGTVQFSSSGYTAKENGGAVVLTVSRTNGSLGTVTLNYATSDGTAVAGVNYQASSGQVFFQDGQNTATITIPIIDAGIINGNTTFSVALSNPSDGASIGANSSALVTILQTDFNVTGPSITGVQAQGLAKLVTGVTVTFDEALDPASATDPSNYTLLAPSGRTGKGPLAPIGFFTPVYDSANHTVSITFAKALPINRFYELLINGASASGIVDLNGNHLQGDGAGTNGTNFFSTFARGTSLNYLDANGNKVTLQLSRGGFLDLYRNASGEGVTLTVKPAALTRSVLTGGVRRLAVSSTGRTSFSEIIAGTFSSVNSQLRTPPFFVDSVTAQVESSTNVSTASVRVASLGKRSAAVSRLFARSFVHKSLR